MFQNGAKGEVIWLKNTLLISPKTFRASWQYPTQALTMVPKLKLFGLETLSSYDKKHLGPHDITHSVYIIKLRNLKQLHNISPPLCTTLFSLETTILMQNPNSRIRIFPIQNPQHSSGVATAQCPKKCIHYLALTAFCNLVFKH